MSISEQIESRLAMCDKHGEYSYRTIAGMEHLSNTECPVCREAKRQTSLLAEIAKKVEAAKAKRLDVNEFERMAGIVSKRDAVCAQHGEYVAVVVVRNGESNESSCPTCREERDRAARLAAMEAERKAAAIRRVESMLDQAAIPLRFADKGFDTYRVESEPQRRAVEKARQYADQLPQRLRDGGGLILTGGKGTGKTHLAIAIGSDAIERHGCSFLFLTVSRLVGAIKETFGGKSGRSERDVYRELVDVDLLALDEVGVQNGTDFERDVLFEVINRRYENMKPTILLSNLPPAEIEAAIGERSMDRMRDGGTAIAFTWDSYRGRK